MKKVFKYMTGQEIPEGAVYLSTVVGIWIEGKEDVGASGREAQKVRIARIVQHYFLVETKETKDKN